MECFICEIFRKINTDDYNTPEHAKRRKTDTGKKNEGKEREKKDICGCQNKGVDKDHIAFFKKRRIINDVTLPQIVYTHTHRVSHFVLGKTLQL